MKYSCCNAPVKSNPKDMGFPTISCRKFSKLYLWSHWTRWYLALFSYPNGKTGDKLYRSEFHLTVISSSQFWIFYWGTKAGVFSKLGKFYITRKMRHSRFICVKQSEVYKQQQNTESSTANLLFIGTCFGQIK